MSPVTSIVKLGTQIQPYEWGSHTAIAEIQGRSTPSDSPEAELWIGDHPNGPSRVLDENGSTPIGEWCAARGADALGSGRDRLPYLVKILAAAEPLSIQLHPDAEQAAEGYAREEAAGIARDAASRSYSDPNPKIEVLCALNRFEALCGLRPGSEVRQLVARSGSVVAAQLLAEAAERASDDELAGALCRRVLQLSDEDIPRAQKLAEEITRYGERGQDGSAEAMWIGQLAAVHPGDRLLIAPLLLNHLVLEPGQALEVPPNTVHSYLAGTGVEVLTSSDNVLRGGLTRKHVASDEFARLLDSTAAMPRVCPAPSEPDRAIAPYPLQIEEFQLSRVSVRPDVANQAFELAAGEPRILLCVRGGLELSDTAQRSTVSLDSGDAALIPACVDAFELAGDAEGFLVNPAP